jgi:hypothetical protein
VREISIGIVKYALGNPPISEGRRGDVLAMVREVMETGQNSRYLATESEF